MSVLSARFLVLASVASLCYAGNLTGMADMTRGNCEIVRGHDWNTTGENLDTLKGVESAEACQEICANTTDCDTFTWGHADANTSGVALTCWLKKPTNETVLATTTDMLTPYPEVDSGACPVETAALEESPGPSFPIWGWILVALGVLGVIGGIAAFMMSGKKETKPKKKKRATAAPPAPPAAPAPAPEAAPMLVAPPVYVAPPIYTAAPVEARAIALPTVVEAPVVTYAAPVAASTVVEAPVVTYAAPVPTYAASTVVEAPVVTYAAPTGSVSMPVAVPATSSFVATAQPVTYITAPAGGLA